MMNDLLQAFDNAIKEQSTPEQWKRYHELINEDDERVQSNRNRL
jgi:type IV secretory pathway component VirB8